MTLVTFSSCMFEEIIGPHLTRQYRRPRPTSDKLGPHSDDSSPTLHLAPDPDPQEGHYNDHLGLKKNLLETRIPKHLQDHLYQEKHLLG